MFRTIMALLIALVAAILIALFQFIDLTGLLALLEADIQGNAMALGAIVFEILLEPYSSAMLGVYSPLVALGVAGFIAGLISKSGVRMLFVSIITIALFFLGYFLLNSLGGITDFSIMLTTIQDMAINIGVAFGLLFIPGIIGASLTAEDY
jgi:hypothetical protein